MCYKGNIRDVMLGEVKYMTYVNKKFKSKIPKTLPIFWHISDHVITWKPIIN